MAEASLGTDELPPYLAEPDGPTHGDDAVDDDRRQGVPHGLVALGRAAHELSERLASPPGGTAPPGGYETRRSVVIHITRHLVMAPADAVAAFDVWLATGRRSRPRHEGACASRRRPRPDRRGCEQCRDGSRCGSPPYPSRSSWSWSGGASGAPR